MRVNNFGEFASFLVERHYENLTPEISQFIECAYLYATMCNCKKTKKAQKYEVCAQQYQNIVLNILPNVKEKILIDVEDKKIEFFSNSFFVGIIKLDN